MMTDFEKRISIEDKTISFLGKISEITNRFNQNDFKEWAIRGVRERIMLKQNKENKNIIKVSADIKIYTDGLNKIEGAVDNIIITWLDETISQIPGYKLNLIS